MTFMRILLLPRAYAILFAGALLSMLPLYTWPNSNYVRVQFGHGASIAVPKNWVVLSGNQRVTLDAYVEALGHLRPGSTLNFAANLYDDSGKTMAVVNARFYPDNQGTQKVAKAFSRQYIEEFDRGLYKQISKILSDSGGKLIRIFPSKMKKINGLYVLVHEHQQIDPGGSEPRTAIGMRVWNSPRSFTVTLSYREREANILRPTIEYMAASLKQE